MLPSQPVVMPEGSEPAGSVSSVRPVPPVAMRPMRLPAVSVNQTLPSNAAVIPVGALPAAGYGYSVTAPAGSAAASPGVNARSAGTASTTTRSRID
jgi:hypothetical protein